MPRPSPLPNSLVSTAFSVATARDLGVTRTRLRASDLTAPFRGVRASRSASSPAFTGAAGSTDPDTTILSGSYPSPVLARDRDIRDRAEMYAPIMGADEWFSRETAASLLGLRLPERLPCMALHVSASADRRAPRRRGVVGHSERPLPVVRVDDLVVSNPVGTWIACAQALTVEELIVMGDGLLGRIAPVTTVEELRTRVDDARGRRGVRRLVRALPHLRPGTDSARETMLRRLLVSGGLPEPSVNLPIRNEFGVVIAHGDLVYPEFRVVLEYDGGGHRLDERQFNIDIERIDEIMELGWRVIRVNKELMRRRATLLFKVETALRAGGWRP